MGEFTSEEVGVVSSFCVRALVLLGQTKPEQLKGTEQCGLCGHCRRRRADGQASRKQRMLGAKGVLMQVAPSGKARKAWIHALTQAFLADVQ